MTLKSINIHQTITDTLISNHHDLSIFDLSITSSNVNPNNLQSYYIIYHEGLQSSLWVSDSKLLFSSTILGGYSGTVQIYNSSFQQSTEAIRIYDMVLFTMIGCTIQNIGIYYRPFPSVSGYVSTGIQIYQCNNVNIFSPAMIHMVYYYCNTAVISC